MRHLKFLPRIAVFIFIFSLTSIPASASFIINATYGSGILNDKNSATIQSTINSVIANYETLITSSISINVTFDTMTTGLGQTTTNIYPILYSNYITALFNHAQSADDLTAIAHLSKTATLDPAYGLDTIYLKGADAKALGVGTFAVTHAASEGTISLNTSIMNLSRSGTQDSNKYDLQSVVSHELDEVLGLGSSVGTGQTYASAEDLFRYLANNGSCSTVKARPTTAAFPTSTTTATCFSIDASTGLAQFNNTGSGDTGDWLTNASKPQVQDASGTKGAQPTLSVELRALDVIGYDLAPSAQFSSTSSQTTTPEPTTFAVAGLALAGLAFRRRKA